MDIFSIKLLSTIFDLFLAISNRSNNFVGEVQDSYIIRGEF